jgi:hypothetical protein
MFVNRTSPSITGHPIRWMGCPVYKYKSRRWMGYPVYKHKSHRWMGCPVYKHKSCRWMGCPVMDGDVLFTNINHVDGWNAI